MGYRLAPQRALLYRRRNAELDKQSKSHNRYPFITWDDAPSEQIRSLRSCSGAFRFLNTA